MEAKLPKLFMLLVGCRPPGRNTEQHDTFFSIAPTVKDLVPGLKAFWPEAKKNLHIDAWREVRQVDGYTVEVHPRGEVTEQEVDVRLFFINLGGYKRDEFDEFHYKLIIAAADKGAAIMRAKDTAFFRHTGFKGATAHVDDKYGVDVDDVYELTDILPEDIKKQYAIVLSKATEDKEDELHLGYFRLDKL
jgi:hypothetical protein